MKKRRILAIVMTVLMMVSLLPSAIFAEAVPSGTLDGKLKVKGKAVVGTELSANFEKVQPEGMTNDYVSFQWNRKDGETLTEVSTEATYTPTEEDLGFRLVLKITGLEDMGVSGELTATTLEVCATEEEAIALEEASKAEEAEETGETAEPESAGQETEEPESSDETVQEIQETEETGDTTDYEDEYITEQSEEDPEMLVEENAGDASGETPEEMQDVVEVEEIYQTEENGETEVVQEVPQETAENTEEIMIEETTEQAGWTELEQTDPEGDAALLEQAAQQGGVSLEISEELSQEEVSYEASANTDDGTGVLDFGTISYGDSEDISAQFATITNNGTGALHFKGISPEHFMVEDITEELPSGESKTVWVQPREGISPGVYEDSVEYITEEGVTAVFTAKVVVEETMQPIAFPEDLAPTDGSADPTPTPTGTPEDPTLTPTEIPTPTPTEEPVISVEVDIPSVDFGEMEVGYGSPSKIITFSNKGNTEVELIASALTNFDVGAITPSVLSVDGQSTINVAPKAGLPAGAYSEELQVTDNQGNVLVTISLAFTVKDKPAPVYKLTLIEPSGQILEFGGAEAGYAQSPATQTITVRNDGDQVLNLQQPANDYFSFGAWSAAQIAPGENSSIAVTPKTGLSVNTYEQNLVIQADNNVSVNVTARFAVTQKAIKLTAVHNGADITGLKNGTKKTAEGLGLPSTVVIETSNGNMNAAVNWDVEGCAYSQGTKKAQAFKVNGTVTLPQGVTNPDNISLTTSVNVSVNAEEVKPTEAPAAKIPADSDTYITGIDPNADYTTETKLTFTAVGGGMDNDNPNKGDIRYIPLNWKVIEARAWDGSPYTATFRMNKAGDYTLTVTYNQQKYKDGEWKKTGEQITRSVNFSVKQSQTVTATPTPVVQNTNRRQAVETGDYTQIIPYIVILIVAVGCIAGVIIYRKKKR